MATDGALRSTDGAWSSFAGGLSARESLFEKDRTNTIKAARKSLASARVILFLRSDRAHAAQGRENAGHGSVKELLGPYKSRVYFKNLTVGTATTLFVRTRQDRGLCGARSKLEELGEPAPGIVHELRPGYAMRPTYGPSPPPSLGARNPHFLKMDHQSVREQRHRRERELHMDREVHENREGPH